MMNLSPLSTFYLPLLFSPLFYPFFLHLLSRLSPLFSSLSPFSLLSCLSSSPFFSPPSFVFPLLSTPPTIMYRSGSYRLGSVYVGLSVHIQRVLHLYSSHETVASFLVAPMIRLSGWCECLLVTVGRIEIYVCIDKIAE